MKRAVLLLLGALLAVSAPASAGTVSSDDARPELTKDDKKLVPVVRDYVRNQRGWIDGSYTIEFYRHDGDEVLFTVWFDTGDSRATIVYHNGQSFRVAVNPKTKKVERELYF